jgi:tetratricopeptide (TPR) repeat protein
MYNLLISLAAGAAVLLAILFGTSLGWVASILPAALVTIGAYFLLARRILKKLEGLFEAAQKELMAQHFEKATQVLQSGFSMAPWQFMVSAQLHSQIGVLYYVRQDFEAALPHLEMSWSRHWVARAMLAISHYRKRDLDAMKKVFENAVGVSKKEGLLWCAYAFCLEKEGRHDAAIAVMSRAAAANSADDKVKGALQTLQNGKKLRPGKIYGEQWFQFHLERIPPELMGMTGRSGRRVVFQRR